MIEGGKLPWAITNNSNSTLATNSVPVRGVGARPTVGRPPNPWGEELVQWQIQKLVYFIEENIERPLRVKELARQINLSVSRFTKRFTVSFGRPPYDYVLSRRMQAAKSFLEDTDEPIVQIACACGLHDQAHLSRLFKRETGLTPRQWRLRSHHYADNSEIADAEEGAETAPAPAFHSAKQEIGYGQRI